ncbi:transposase [Pseudonocardia sp. MCCB 268]|nr:transposase [Pseudonocardia cytotoxica]
MPPSTPATTQSGARVDHGGLDSTHVAALDQNLVSLQWHSRCAAGADLLARRAGLDGRALPADLPHSIRGRGDGRGAVRHGTSMQVDGNYVDSTASQEIGFGITRLLGSSCCHGSSRSTA